MPDTTARHVCTAFLRPSKRAQRPTVHAARPCAPPPQIVAWLDAGYLASAEEAAFDGLTTLLESSVLSISHDIDFGLVDLSSIVALPEGQHSSLQEWQRQMPTCKVRPCRYACVQCISPQLRSTKATCASDQDTICCQGVDANDSWRWAQRMEH
jgi:hypothetical protein